MEDVKELCQHDESGNVLKTRITVENYEKLSKLIEGLDIEVAKKKKVSYREYCKLFDGYLLKSSKCGEDHVCCQAITNDGKRCKRPASEFTTLDLTQIDAYPKIPEFVKKNFDQKQLFDLRVAAISFGCCFYCSQHAKMYLSDKLTSINNFSYYATHPEDILSIFFDGVVPKKFYGTVTVGFEKLGNLRSPEEITNHLFRVYAEAMGVLSVVYFKIWLVVFLSDYIGPYLEKAIQKFNPNTKGKQSEEILKNVILTAAYVLLELGKRIN